MSYPIELESIDKHGFNMSGFIPLLYSIAKFYHNGQKSLRTVLEIGVRWGTSTNALLYGIRDSDRKHPTLQLYSMDIKDCSGVVKDESLKKYWTFIFGDSKTLEWSKEVDVLLIDGDHSYEGVKADYLKYEPFVKSGGIILMHDVLWGHKGPIKVFWDEVKYPKVVLPLSRSGLGVIYKILPPYYEEEKIKFNHVG